MDSDPKSAPFLAAHLQYLLKFGDTQAKIGQKIKVDTSICPFL